MEYGSPTYSGLRFAMRATSAAYFHVLPIPRFAIADAIESSSSRRNFSHFDWSTHAPLSACNSCTGSTITCCDAIGDSGGGGCCLVPAPGLACCARRPPAHAAMASIPAIVSDRVLFIDPVVRDGRLTGKIVTPHLYGCDTR